ncbi:P-loop containing nucleoside triphosphate hydrolase protein [Lipomyces arxii]|uniref:P-loop containing nucleoside triphosphate hydrolase protein n=1 Tax=Lipomyces arxii TaxID=56418 RepID=UPI0034CEB455
MFGFSWPTSQSSSAGPGWQVRFLLFLVGSAISSYMISSLMRQMLAIESKPKRKASANDALKKLKLKRPDLDLEGLNEYEMNIMAEVIAPEDIHLGFEDIGGLEDIIKELRESVLYPLTMPGVFSQNSPLLQAPKGVLLYGPPGCGKTMLAKALAAESSATFINIKISSILDKWFGESNKIVAAIFSLARKLQPSIIFIDEIDSFLRERQSNEHEVISMLKAEFMTLWDGLTSDGRILVLGATNRPNDIDSAFLRRMPKRFAIKLPNADQRRRILHLMLKGTELDVNFDLEAVVAETVGLSGSYIQEACRDAAMVPAREYFSEHYTDGIKNAAKADTDVKLRPLKTNDFFITRNIKQTTQDESSTQRAPDVE